MGFLRDRQFKCYFIFILCIGLCIIALQLLICGSFGKISKQQYILQKQLLASSLLEQGISREIIMNSLSYTDVSKEGKEFLADLGLDESTGAYFIPEIFDAQKRAAGKILVSGILLTGSLLAGTVIFFKRREQNYSLAVRIVKNFAEGDFTEHLPSLKEGELYNLYHSIDNLARMLFSQKETVQKTKEFLKGTISDISHQLKTPLAALGMYNEIILEEADDEKLVRDFSVKITAALGRMENLIQELLKITRLDAGAISFELQDYPISDVVERAAENLRIRAEKEGKKIILEGAEEVMLRCDLQWTGEAIGNLIKNALDYTKEGNTVAVSWEKFPERIRILVSDNGCGIAEEDIYHIFNRFYRVSHNRNGSAGTGLGLPLAKSIIENQGGLLTAESVQGEGSTFIITFMQ